MLQQTTVPAVRRYFSRFLHLWPTVADLAAARDEDVMAEWAGLGYYARARNLLKCARFVTEFHDGRFPHTEAELLNLPGVGPYTSAAIAAIAFDRRAVVVDGNVERVMARFHGVDTPLPTAKPALTQLAAQHTPTTRPGDYAQAVMDLGATICTPKSPACGICPLVADCEAHKHGNETELPRKLPKQPKPICYGIAYVARRRDGALLLERRPDKGLLGGMLGWPGSAWGERQQPNPPFEADWIDAGTEVRHTFTHFHLRLSVKAATTDAQIAPQGCRFVAVRDFDPGALPTVMRKVWNLASSAFPPL